MAEFGSWNGCKPGSVPACYKRMPISHDRCSHLTIDLWLIHPFGSFPAGWCPYLISGCSLVGFTSFHFVRFQTNSVTVALSEYSQPITLDLAWFLRRQTSKFLLPTFADGTNTPGISAPGEPGLSSTLLTRAATTHHFMFCCSSATFIVYHTRKEKITS